ncbi:MAG: hypothetical protein WBD28_06335 [Candidatus Zixiibacteriota bacterium]
MRKIILFFLLFVFICSSNSVLAKKPGAHALDAHKVKKIEWIDPWGRKPTGYSEFLKNQPPPQSLKIQSLKRFEKERLNYKGALSFLVLVIVNSNLYSQVQSSITQYEDDLIDQGYAAEVILWSGGNSYDLRNYLQSRFPEGLVGAVLIGDLPVSWFEYDLAEFPCDLYLMDLDGTWQDLDMDGILDNHSDGSGDVSPEIWIGRLDPSRLTWGGQAQLLQNYFTKNHNYRLGILSLPHRALSFVDDDWEYFEDCDLSWAYNDVTTINSSNQTTAIEYKSRLMQNYEWIHVCTHSSCWAHTFRINYQPLEGQSVFNYEVHALDPHAFFYNLFACSNTRFVETNCLGNWYIFGDEYGLAAVGSAKSGSMLDFQFFYQPLGMGESIGESFKYWFCVMGGDGFEPWEITWFYGMNILGDPTLTIDTSPASEAPPYSEESEKENPSSSWPSLQVTTNEFSQGNPAITMDFTGKPWVVWEDGRHIRTNLYSSYFEGEKWSAPVPVQIYEYWDLHPALTTDSLGNIWAVWQSLRDVSGYNFNVCASYHDGISWSSPELITTGPQYDLEPAVATDRNGKIWVAWKSWKPENSQVSSEIMASYFNWSYWHPPMRVTSDTFDNCDPSITSDETGKVWIAWASNRDSDWNIYSSYYDGSWSLPVAVTTHSADDLQAKITTDGAGKVWVAWQSFRDGNANIYMSSNGGSGWSLPYQITSDTLDDISPSFSQNSSESIWLSWMSKRCGNWDIFASLYDGLSWSYPRQITDNTANDYLPAVITDTNGEGWAVWATDRDLNWNIYSAFSYILPPDLVYPPNCSYINDNTPLFQWSTLGSFDSATYILEFSQDSMFVSDVTTISEIPEKFFQLPDTLALVSDTDYYWKVRIVVGDSDSSDFSSVFRFTLDTQAPAVPALLSPSDDTLITNTTPVFEWTSAIFLINDPNSILTTDPKDAPVKYTLEYSLDSDFVEGIIVVDSLMETQYVVPDIQHLDSCNNYYFWRIRAEDLSGNESGYQENSFRFMVYTTGMVDEDCEVGITDVVYLINYLFKNGPEPVLLEAGDINCDDGITISDAVYLVNYLFKSGPQPCRD